jgi:hypothetical protein
MAESCSHPANPVWNSRSDRYADPGCTPQLRTMPAVNRRAYSVKSSGAYSTATAKIMPEQPNSSMVFFIEKAVDELKWLFA